MFLFDPARGRRRRALLRDRAVHSLHAGTRGAGATARDLNNRARGVLARGRSVVDRSPVDDDVLTARVRSALGRLCRHPRSIEVVARDGRVTLSGPILGDDVRQVLRGVRDVPGVRDVENRLDVHEHAGSVPGLQGDGGQPPPPVPKPELLQRHWAPGPRFLAGAAGGTLAAFGARRRDLMGTVLGLSGGALLARAATNLPLERLTGVRANRRAIDVHKTIVVRAPLEQVWEFWDGFERFPRFMTHVRDVTVGADGTSHWVVDGPAGTALRWDAQVTERIPNQVFAWKTCPGQAIQHSGIVRFEPVGSDTTRISIPRSYNPIAGAAGHTVARVLGADPKRRLDA
ncbi:MAG: BON domain-containing protein, partial [Actinomycetota bacterium]|nr:BON domain-containing protein [Actinomycetota bacterium]